MAREPPKRTRAATTVAVKCGLVGSGAGVNRVRAGTKMGRKSFIHIELHIQRQDIPSRIEGGGSVMPVLRGELL